MAEPPPGASAALRDPELRAMIRLVWHGRAWIGGSAGLAIALALAWLHLTPPEYRAVMLVAAVPGVGADAGAGPPGEPAAARLDRYAELLGSIEVARRLVRWPALLPALFPAEWDDGAARWRPPPGPAARLGRAVATVAGRPGWQPPGPERAARELRRRLRLDTVGSDRLRRLSFGHADRDLAIEALDRLHRVADGVLREAAVDRTRAAIAFLEGQLSGTRRHDRRADLDALVERHQRTLMLLAAGLPYAAEIVDGPDAPAVPGWPDPVLVLPAAAAAGLALGTAAVFLREALRGGSDARDGADRRP